LTTLDEVEETARRWAQFRNLGKTRDHWQSKDGWSQSRAAYRWLVPFGHSTKCRDLGAYCLTRLELKAFDAAEPRYLHSSLQQIAFADCLPSNRLDGVITAVGSALNTFPAFDVTIGPVDPNSEAMVLRISPWHEITFLRRLVRNITQHVLRDVALPGADDHFWPHISIAYSNSEQDVAPLLERLLDLQGLSTTRVRVDTVELVLLKRENRVWTWQSVASLTLASDIR
jgi:2'-5' RNA ligase